MKFSRYNLFFCLMSILFIIVSSFLDLKMFHEGSSDGFYSQVSYVSNFASGQFELSPLIFIHILRLVAVLPFFISHELGLPAVFESLFFLFYLAPIIKSKDSALKSYVFIFCVMLPVFFSYRTVLAMLGMFYLYVCLFYVKRNYFYLVFSSLLVNLSSGVVLSWVIAMLGSIQYIFNYYRLVIPVFFCVSIGFVFSMLHKYYYMLTMSGADLNGTFYERSTLYVSYISDDYYRLAFYTFFSILALFMLFVPLLSKRFSVRKYFFFLGALPLIFFEGIGLVSYLICFSFFIVKELRVPEFLTFSHH